LKYTHTITPLAALSEFKPNFYDLLLMDINIPNINDFELCQKILELDVNVRVCFISAGEVNIEALREISKCKHEMFYQETSFNRLFGQRLSAVRIVIALEAI
jgi:two-component SAPR family response regulator